MDSKTLFWTYAQLILTACVFCALYGVRKATQGDIRKHRQAMDLSCYLILFFVASYAFKLVFLGREAIHTWEPVYVTLLRVHESFIFVMLITGGISRFLSRRLQEGPRGRLWSTHKRLGHTARVCALASWITASFVLFGMYQRAPSQTNLPQASKQRHHRITPDHRKAQLHHKNRKTKLSVLTSLP